MAQNKGTQVSTVLNDEELAAVEDFRWENRIDRRSEVVRRALRAYVGLPEQVADEDESETADAEA